MLAHSSETLRLFFFSDWRIAPLSLAEARLRAAGPVDLIVYGGDDVARFAPATAVDNAVLEALQQYCHKLARRKYGRMSTQHIRQLLPTGSDDLVWPLSDGQVWLGDPDPLIEHARWLLRRPPSYQPASLDGLWTPERVLRLFASKHGKTWLERIAPLATHGVAAIIGNDCYPEDRHLLRGPRVHDLHRAPLRLGAWGFVGIEGAIVSTEPLQGSPVNNVGYVLHPDRKIEEHLQLALTSLGTAPDRTVIVSHTPPRGALDIGIRFGLEQLGSPSLARFVRRYRPPLVLCGHVHSHGGKIEHIGSTVVVNAACDDTSAKKVRAALIELAPGAALRVNWLDPTQHSVLYYPGTGPVMAERLRKVGIRRRDELLQANDAVLKRAGFGPDRLKRFRAYQTAFGGNVHVWLRKRPLELPDKFVFYDVETGLGFFHGSSIPWMVAAMVESGTRVEQWTAPTSGKREMFRDFLAFVKDHPGATLCSWSGTRFDDRAIQAGLESMASKLCPLWTDVPKLDLLTLIRRHVIIPTVSWTLGLVATFCGFPNDPDDTLDGFMVGLKYECFRKWGHRLPIKAIQRRNVNDVRRLAHIAKWLRAQNSLLANGVVKPDRRC